MWIMTRLIELKTKRLISTKFKSLTPNERRWSMKKKYLIIDAYIKNVCKNVHSRHIEREIKDELFSHLMEHYERQIALGKSDEEAQKFAVSCMGDSESISKTFEKLYDGTEKLVGNTIWSLFIGILWQTTRFIWRSSQMFYIGLGFAHQLISLNILKKINHKFNTAFIALCCNTIFMLSGYFAYDYFSLSLEFKYFIFIISGILSCIEYTFVFLGIRDVEKENGNTEKSLISPVISIILMVISQALAVWIVFVDTAYAFLILLACGATGAFPIAMLLGHSVDILENYKWDFIKLTKEERRIRCIAIFLLLLLIFAPFIVANRPAKTVDFVAHNIETDINVTEIRENLISLGLPENVANELPDSEILKYQNTEKIEIESDDNSWSTNLAYESFAFYLPKTELQPKRVRVLLVISGFESLEGLDRHGLYIDSAFPESEFECDLEAYDGTFMQILCDIDNETRQVVPFYQIDLNSSEHTEEPIGCEYGYPKNSKNFRIYAAQTVIPSAEKERFNISYSFYYDLSILSYKNSVDSQRTNNYSRSDYICAGFDNPEYTEPEVITSDEVPSWLDGSADFEEIEDFDNIDELIEYYNP